MRVSRPSMSLCRPALGRRAGSALVAVSALVTASAATTASATPHPSDLRISAPRTGAANEPEAVAPTAVAPTAVPPRVVKLSVPAVAVSNRASTMAKLSPGATDSVPLGSHRPLVAHLRQPTMHAFSLVGVTWEPGSAAPGTTVSVRSRSAGSWSDWTPLAIDPEEGPAASEDTSTQAGTDPAWVGDATGVEVAVSSPDGSTPKSLTVSAIDPGTSSYDVNAKSALTGATATTSTTAEPGTFPGIPDIITRQEWGADPALGDACWDPIYGDTFSMVFVHHTAGSNNYSESESAAVVRGVYAYHTQSRGWCDIGYNFLVDRYGNVYEGRRGGILLPVRGAHAGDYNVDTTGISLMGDFTSASPTRAMKHALVQLIAWRMGTAYHGAYGHPLVNGKRFNRISGHRDAMSTSCPGQQVYDWLPTLRTRVATRLGDYVSPIEARWRRMGGADSRLGLVGIGEEPENGGRHTAFQGGRMYDSPDGGLHALYSSPILLRYRSYGGVLSSLGYPHSGLRSAAGGTGLTAEFAGGRIYSSTATGARVLVRGPILKRYLAEGAAGSRLGFPTSPVRQTSTGSIAHFEHGSITRDATTHTTVVSYS